jgi:hypothetical protein
MLSLLSIAQMCLSDLQGRVEAGKLQVFEDCIENMKAQAEDIAELEGKLEDALEALKRIGKGEFAGQMLMSLPPQDAGAHFARMTLATIKLKGSKHERI